MIAFKSAYFVDLNKFKSNNNKFRYNMNSEKLVKTLFVRILEIYWENFNSNYENFIIHPSKSKKSSFKYQKIYSKTFWTLIFELNQSNGIFWNLKFYFAIKIKIISTNFFYKNASITSCDHDVKSLISSCWHRPTFYKIYYWSKYIKKISCYHALCHQIIVAKFYKKTNYWLG